MIDFAQAPAHDITVQGLIFSARQIYDEGHPLTEKEAGVLNQTRDENLRNNYAPKIRAKMADEKVDKAEDLKPETVAELQKKFPDYEEDYEFGSRGGAREVDPVRKQAHLFSTASVKKALLKKGYKLSEVGPERIKALATKAVEDHPKFMEKAKLAVDAREAAAKDLDIDVA